MSCVMQAGKSILSYRDNVKDLSTGKDQWSCIADLRSSWASSGENVSSGVSDQVRLKPACSATETSYNLEISAIESRDIIISKQWTTKALIRLRRCAGRSVPLLFAYDIRHVFSWPRSVSVSPVDVPNEPGHKKTCHGVSDQLRLKPACSATETS